MNGKTILCLLLLSETVTFHIQAQVIPFNSGDMEDLLYRDESAIIPEPDFDLYTGSGSLSLNLNTATSDELESSGIFTPYQVYHLLKYREKFGPLYSIYELTALPGFHSKVVRQIESLVCLKQKIIPDSKKTGHHMVLVKLEKSFPDPEDSEKFAGPLLKSTIRIRSSLRTNVSLGLSYEKDAGEPVLYAYRPQFLSGYLNFEGKSFLKQVVIGNYRLNQGLGLVNGTGFLHRAGDLLVNRRSLSRIKAYASLPECHYEQGTACRMGTKDIQFLLWASYRKFSISPSAVTEHPEPGQWFDLQRSSGLFRTSNEMACRNLAYRIHTGIQVLYYYKYLSIGILGGTQWVGPGKKITEVLEKLPNPSLRHKLSLHGNWHNGKTQVFGEIAASEFHSLAFLLGAACQFNDFIRGSLLVHHYGSEYRGSLPSSYSSGSQIRNEQGLAFHLYMESGKALIIKLTGELFRFPFPRYLTRVPSEGYRLELRLQNPTGNSMQWRIRLVRKYWQTTPADKIFPLRPLQESIVNRIDGQLIYKHQDRISWMSRLVIAYCSHRNNSSNGYAAVQQLTLNWDYFKATARMVLFHVDEWANRIYLHEPGFYYSFNFPAFYGSGKRTTLLLTCRALKRLTFSAKVSGTKKTGKLNWDIGIQIRVNI